jgi:hypothetical protein
MYLPRLVYNLSKNSLCVENIGEIIKYLGQVEDIGSEVYTSVYVKLKLSI